MGPAVKTCGVVVLGVSAIFLATGTPALHVLGFWVTVGVVIGAVHFFSGGTGGVR